MAWASWRCCISTHGLANKESHILHMASCIWDSMTFILLGGMETVCFSKSVRAARKISEFDLKSPMDHSLLLKMLRCSSRSGPYVSSRRRSSSSRSSGIGEATSP